MDRVKVAVVGTGYLGSLHAKFYAGIPECELTAVCDTNSDNLARITAAFSARSTR